MIDVDYAFLNLFLIPKSRSDRNSINAIVIVKISRAASQVVKRGEISMAKAMAPGRVKRQNAIINLTIWPEYILLMAVPR